MKTYQCFFCTFSYILRCLTHPSKFFAPMSSNANSVVLAVNVAIFLVKLLKCGNITKEF